MPIKIDGALPARRALEAENIFVMTSERAMHQDIRPLEIAIVNLMPAKIDTEIQLLRLMANSPIQVNIDLLHTESYTSRHSSPAHLERFYTTFSRVEKKRYDGMIITGAPVETLPFTEVDYWDELAAIMEHSKKNVYSTLHICWGAFAGLWYHYGIDKLLLSHKLTGVFEHRRMDDHSPLFRGFDDCFPLPHSRYTGIDEAALKRIPRLEILARSKEAGSAVIQAQTGRQIFITGHFEYDADTLAKEYQRDTEKGLDVPTPAHYFPQDNPNAFPISTWRAHAHLFFSNWLNYSVYQATPYDLGSLKPMFEEEQQ
ncbi:homoserine O-succinyltransferase [Sediminispirochaeta smaragdinae]|uniref:Homoserine O-acetyltransferase n=1 Tax=Sediminispirochaeta smaragdinae (strain DSM 11293 / JCM 15392 / SEBR 4228) TaxID=573413 RepID=E1R3T0_SEDSS|nr:homoserine O-succinyltransferase [Sediminispirochaeta smaragdinae]ADK82051.1 homoserine O-succinyltransferase [Sediminispirochaeta smaragdinae DSM 11293]